MDQAVKNVILFASGGGSNVAAILDYFKDIKQIEFPLIVTNNAKAGVINIAKQHNIDLVLVDKEHFQSPIFIDTLDLLKPDLLVLAGFLWKIPSNIVNHFPFKIINIHPALLPAYSGKGMYGHYVHEAVVANHEKETGITIHFVNEQYDEGTTLLQKKISILPTDNAETVAKNVLKLEHAWYSKVIESLLFGSQNS
jgi:phosphoribosylglycinamide formyltransferase-1